MDDWRCSGLTRREYASLHEINFNTFKHWPAQLETQNLKNTAHEPARHVLPVAITPSVHSTPAISHDAVMVYLPNGYRVACQTSQLNAVFQALADAKA
ncbi:IS66 family insertion sequence element accessory protein TnpA [Providencia rettgeri]|uniref:IS66 family insertion sequence element accessory protein TnpA n=1 Tax=Providencia rettgeri TaxID=587 RepID=UPI0011DE4333|nr:hypothetical protein I6L79_18790 [Providencia rettgeri]